MGVRSPPEQAGREQRHHDEAKDVPPTRRSSYPASVEFGVFASTQDTEEHVAAIGQSALTKSLEKHQLLADQVQSLCDDVRKAGVSHRRQGQSPSTGDQKSCPESNVPSIFR